MNKKRKQTNNEKGKNNQKGNRHSPPLRWLLQGIVESEIPASLFASQHIKHSDY